MKKLLVFFLSFICFGTFCFSAENWVAKVDEKIITKKEFDQVLKQQEETMSIMSGRSINKQLKNKAIQKNILLSYISQQLLMKRIQKENKEHHFINKAQMQRFIKQIKQNLETKIYIGTYKQNVLEKKIKPITNSELEKVYNKNLKNFQKRQITKEKAYEIIKARYIEVKANALLRDMAVELKQENSIVLNPGFATGEKVKWIAKINGKVLTSQQFDQTFEVNLQIAQVMSGGNLDLSKMRSNANLKKTYLSSYIMTSLLVKKLKAMNRKISFINDSEIQRKIQQVSKNIEAQFYVDKYVEKILLPKIGEVPQKEIENYYNKNRKAFQKMSASDAADLIKKRLKERAAAFLLRKVMDRLNQESRIIINHNMF